MGRWNRRDVRDFLLASLSWAVISVGVWVIVPTDALAASRHPRIYSAVFVALYAWLGAVASASAGGAGRRRPFGVRIGEFLTGAILLRIGGILAVALLFGDTTVLTTRSPLAVLHLIALGFGTPGPGQWGEYTTAWAISLGIPALVIWLVDRRRDARLRDPHRTMGAAVEQGHQPDGQTLD